MCPDGKWSTLDMVAEGDKVAYVWVIGIYTLADGKIVSLRKLDVEVDFYTAFGLPSPTMQLDSW